MIPKEEDYVPGDLVYKSARWAAAYPTWNVSRGVIMTSRKSIVLDSSLGASDRNMYQERYGKQEWYPCFEILIATPQGNYRISQFGFNKDNEEEHSK
jgi:hypothetical protein